MSPHPSQLSPRKRAGDQTVPASSTTSPRSRSDPVSYRPECSRPNENKGEPRCRERAARKKSNCEKAYKEVGRRWLHRMLRRLSQIADAIGFPDHEIVQDLPGFVHDKSDDDCVINEAEQRSHVRNQIEWLDQIVESSHDPHQIIIRNLLVIAALVCAD